MTKPILSIIAAMAHDRVIGQDNCLPWHLPADLQHFKRTSMGKPMIMGRKTWESLPGLLPGRQHILVTRNPSYMAEGAEVAHSLEQAIAIAGDVPEIMLVGGANLYAQALDVVDRMYLTEIDLSVEGDVHFPEFDRRRWKTRTKEAHTADEKNVYPYTFLELEKIK